MRVLTYSWIRRINTDGDKKVLVYDISTGQETEVLVDEVIFYTGRKQNNSLHSMFKSLVEEVYEVGDCHIAGGKILSAIDEGFSVAMKI